VDRAFCPSSQEAG